MQKYIDDVLELAKVRGQALTPATLHLFDVDEEAAVLSADEKQLFHSLVAKLYYLSKRARPDILTALSFLTTRVQAPTQEDYGKLLRVLKYLNHAKELGIVLRPADGPITVEAYADAAYGNHQDFKSHTGLVITLGTGPVFVKSTKQTLVTKSSAEAELVALADSATQVLWSREFLQEQGYILGAAKIYQDNQAAIRMMNGGRASTSPKSRHINVRYFFLTDRIAAGEVTLEYLATADMVADLLTKPLQGEDFRRLRQVLLNWRF
jgi:hypothetical protein